MGGGTEWGWGGREGGVVREGESVGAGEESTLMPLREQLTNKQESDIFAIIRCAKSTHILTP